MKLSHLLREVELLAPPPDIEVSGIAVDSRLVQPGDVFFAVVQGVDRYKFLEMAVQRGAVAVVGERADVQAPIPHVQVADARAALAEASAALYGYPARELTLIGVTGTDGKTSLAHLIDHVLRFAGEPAGLISTAECRIGDRPLTDTGRFTTPEAPELQGMLGEIVEAGCRWAVVEATSHGLALHRLDECEFDIAVVTCVGADHLDFHGTAEDYLAAKGRLFEMLGESAQKGVAKTAVLNADDRSYAYLKGVAKGTTLSYGLSRGDITAAAIREEGWASRFVVDAGGARRDVTVPRQGLFNVYNALAGIGVCLAAGLDIDRITAGIASWPGAPGRMERIDEGQPFTVVVDFAHAPDALRRVLELLRSRGRGRVIAVFGSIGERERDRRPAMGRVAAEAADFTIVTDDNPYSEDRETILREIATGLRAAGRREGHDFAIIPDRREAIAYALGMAVDEDAVLLAGKGHERDVHLADSVYDCDDRDVARRCLREILRA